MIIIIMLLLINYICFIRLNYKVRQETLNMPLIQPLNMPCFNLEADRVRSEIKSSK